MKKKEVVDYFICKIGRKYYCGDRDVTIAVNQIKKEAVKRYKKRR